LVLDANANGLPAVGAKVSIDKARKSSSNWIAQHVHVHQARWRGGTREPTGAF
jgi:hypothetical protein